MIKKISITVVFLFFLVIPKRTLAAEFATSYDVLYDVDNKGQTTVTEKINLKNLTSEYYANQFKLTVGATEVFDIKATDPSGLLEVSSEQKGNSTVIGVKFNQQMVGLGKVLPWVITFKTKDFAQNLGKIWEVKLPKVSSTANMESYNVTLAVPQNFGEPSLINPAPLAQSASNGKIFLTFNLNQLKNSGISVTFGSIQLFDFDLTYHLQNSSLTPVLKSITLPPDTSFQDIIFQRITPRPFNVTVDGDGNYLAWYRLNRSQKLDVRVFGSAKLYTTSKVRNPVLDETLRKEYTKSQKYWEKDNPQITAKLNEILASNPPEDEAGKVRLIYQFVVDYLKYDPERLLKDNIERLGASAALNNPNSAVCMEFTDLFIALSRAAGIPARELNGYAYSANAKSRPLSLTKDILHSWPEYFDERRGWVMVDPTWENTTGGVDYFNKLDLNHFVFAIKGLSSQNPIPAGSYKYVDQDSHDVKVTLSDKDFLGHPQIDVKIDTANPVFAGFPGLLRVKITNAGNAFYPSALLSVHADKLAILNGGSQAGLGGSYESGIIPAFGTAQFDFNIRTKSLFDSYNDQIAVVIGGQNFTKDVSIRPFVLFQTTSLLIEGVVALMALIYIIVLGGHIYRRRKRFS